MNRVKIPKAFWSNDVWNLIGNFLVFYKNSNQIEVKLYRPNLKIQTNIEDYIEFDNMYKLKSFLKKEKLEKYLVIEKCYISE